MNVIFDSSVIIDLFNPKISGDYREILDDLIKQLKKGKFKILIPAPVLTEIMVRAEAAKDKYFSLLSKSTSFQIVPFDAKAAMECAALLEEAFSRGERGKITKTKFKFDWQIAAVALSRNATMIYSEDDDLARCAARVNINFCRPSTLPLPESAKQRPLDLRPRDMPGKPQITVAPYHGILAGGTPSALELSEPQDPSAS